MRRRLDLKEGAPLQLHTFPEPQTPLDVLRDYISSEVRVAADHRSLSRALRLVADVAGRVLTPLEAQTVRLPLGAF